MHLSHSFMSLQYCSLNSPTRPAREGCHPSSQATSINPPPGVCGYNLSSDQFENFFTHYVYCMCLDSVKRGVICLSLSSMIPPTLMEKASSQSNLSVNIDMLIKGSLRRTIEMAHCSAGVEADGKKKKVKGKTTKLNTAAVR